MSRHVGAFPGKHWDQEGMTLRDYFAAKALQSFLTAGDGIKAPSWEEVKEKVAKMSYEYADAMLKERENG